MLTKGALSGAFKEPATGSSAAINDPNSSFKIGTNRPFSFGQPPTETTPATPTTSRPPLSTCAGYQTQPNVKIAVTTATVQGANTHSTAQSACKTSTGNLGAIKEEKAKVTTCLNSLKDQVSTATKACGLQNHPTFVSAAAAGGSAVMAATSEASSCIAAMDLRSSLVNGKSDISPEEAECMVADYLRCNAPENPVSIGVADVATALDHYSVAEIIATCAQPESDPVYKDLCTAEVLAQQELDCNHATAQLAESNPALDTRYACDIIAGVSGSVAFKIFECNPEVEIATRPKAEPTIAPAYKAQPHQMTV